MKISIVDLRRGVACVCIVSITLTAPGVPLAEAGLAAIVPTDVSTLTPSSRLGRIVDRYGRQRPSVIFIQDLHFNYGVQKNIAEILAFLSEKLYRPSLQRAPFALAVEGAAGSLDYSALVQYPYPDWKKSLMEFLLRHGEITGPEQFAILTNQPTLLIGVENDKYYRYHRELFRQSHAQCC